MARHDEVGFQGRVSRWWVTAAALFLLVPGGGSSRAWGAPPITTGDMQSGEGTPFEEPEAGPSSDTQGNGDGGQGIAPELSQDLGTVETISTVSPWTGKASIILQFVGPLRMLLRNRI